MFKKLIGLTALAGVVALGSGFGCSSTPVPGDTDGGTESDASATPDATTIRDTGTPDRNVPAASCYAEDEALALQGTAPTAAQNKCTSALITQFASACLGSGSQATCDAFIQANGDCARCIIGPVAQTDDPKTMPLPVLIPVSPDGSSVSPNVAACAALVAGRGDCTVKLTNQVVCTATACDTCEDDAAAEACDAEATAGICKDTVDAACNTAVNNASAQWQTICRGTGFDDTYVKVANYLCGAGAGDAGGGG